MVLELFFDAMFALANLVLSIMPEFPELSTAITSVADYAIQWIQSSMSILAVFVDPPVVQVIMLGVITLWMVQFACAIISAVFRLVKLIV